MRVLTLIPNQKGYSPGQRGSIELWEKILRREGILLDFVSFETDEMRKVLYSSGNYTKKLFEMVRAYARRIKMLEEIDTYDAVFVYREAALIGPAFLEKYIAKRKPIIYQLDDPLFVPYKSPHSGYFSYLKFFGKIKEIIRMSTVVMVNSSHIRDYASQFNKNIWQVPSVVDTDIFRYQPFPEHSIGTIGWSGSPTTLKNLKLIEGPLSTLSAKGHTFHFIGGDNFDLTDVNYSAQKWNAETEVDDLRKMQIGLVPLPDNGWNKHKFIMKTAQYMALGIVPVGTPMASNLEVIRHGVNGFLAANDAEWVEYLSLLSDDEKLRKQLSQTSADDAEKFYSLKANTGKIVEAFRNAVS
ncbi:MAG: glycosyltransferase [Pyrinomonadaceae bacterium]|nr:glycosyltransferase [Pyrinomonadaceae bacterium]